MSVNGASPSSPPVAVPAAPATQEPVEEAEKTKTMSGPRRSIHFDHVAWTPPPSLTPRKNSFLLNTGANAGSGSPLAQAAAAALVSSPMGPFSSPRARASSAFAKTVSVASADDIPLMDLLLHQLRPWLFLGDAEAAHSLHILQTNKITHILNVAEDVENMFPDDFQYENLHVKDFGQDSGISRVFEQAAKFAEEVKKSEGKKLLVHCFAGMNRSPTIIIALFMILEKKTLKEAFCEVKRKSPSTGLFEDSRRELLKYELEIFGKNTMTLEDFSRDVSHMDKEHRRQSSGVHAHHSHHGHAHSHPHPPAAETKSD